MAGGTNNNIRVDNFGYTLAVGEQIELEVLSLIRKKYPRAKKRYGKFKGFDIEVPEANKTVEVKYDIKSGATGNFFIEWEFNGEPSGLQSSTASFWVLVDAEYYFFLEAEVLKLLLREHSCRLYEWTGEDGTKVKSYLLKKSILEYSPYVIKIKRPQN